MLHLHQFPLLLLSTTAVSAENQDDFQLDVSKLTVKTKVTIFDSTVDSFDGGDELADWLSNFTGARVRLSYNPTNRDVVEANPGFENYWRLGAIV